MFKRLFRAFKRALVFILILGGIALIVMTIINTRNFFSKRDPISVIIDIDTGASVDRKIALIRALISKELNITAITSVHGRNHSSGNRISARRSYELNDSILGLMGIINIPNLSGADEKMVYSSGSRQKSSAAADYFIRKAKEIPRGEKLNIITLGCLTNPAMAIQKDPSIISKISIYSLGVEYNTKSGVWNKNESNIRGDLDAFDLLLNTPGLEFNIMPVKLASDLKISNENILSFMQVRSAVWQYIIASWKETAINSKELPMPALAMIESMVNPQYTKSRAVITPPENLRRKVNVYTFINYNQMLYSFENSLKKELKD